MNAAGLDQTRARFIQEPPRAYNGPIECLPIKMGFSQEILRVCFELVPRR